MNKFARRIEILSETKSSYLTHILKKTVFSRLVIILMSTIDENIEIYRREQK